MSDTYMQRIAVERAEKFRNDRELDDLSNDELETFTELLDDGTEYMRVVILEPMRRLFAELKSTRVVEKE